ncbi:nose resistant to fluoxetine protein 6-like, partial [Tropilaelaps mercedesae]
CFFWGVAFLAGGFSLIAVRFWVVGTPGPQWAILYAALQRPVWSLAIGWLLFACCSGHGGIISTVLGCRQLVPLSRLSYAVYLCHAYVLYANSRAIHERKEASHFSIFRDAAAVLLFSTVLALAVAALFEAPIVAIQRIVLRRICKDTAGPPDRPVILKISPV